MADSSIFDYLTMENPRVTSPLKARGNTSDQSYVIPKQLRKWEDFNMDVFEQLYGGELMEEAHRARPGFHVPFIDEEQRQVLDERATWHLLEHWTVFMTKEALRAVRDTLHPATWSLSVKPPRQTTGAKPEKRSKSKRDKNNKGKDKKVKTKANKTDNKAKRKDGSKLKVDAGTIALCRPCQLRDAQSFWGTRQRMPKEIKFYPKFSSERIVQRLDEQGFWDPEKRNVDDEMPIRQAYTYCVTSGCRYGCILTAHEAFIFRIRPIGQPADSDGNLEDRQPDEIREALWEDGLMEYTAIPWETHRARGRGTFKELTVNFSLWILHILAGNAHEVQWAYDSLLEESLVGQCRLALESDAQGTSLVGDGESGLSIDVAHDTPRIPSFMDTPSRKRPRGDEQDPIMVSFREDPLFDPSPSKSSYLDRYSDTDEDQADGDHLDEPTAYTLSGQGTSSAPGHEPRSSAAPMDASSANTTARKRVKRAIGSKT